MPQYFSCGYDFAAVRDVRDSLELLAKWKYLFGFMPIVHPRFRRDFRAGKAVQTAFTRTDMLINPTDWNLKVVGKISPYLHLDSDVHSIRQQHEDAFLEEMNHCRGLGLSTVVVSLWGPKNFNLGRVMLNFYQSNHMNITIWVKVSMENPNKRCLRQSCGESSDGKTEKQTAAEDEEEEEVEDEGGTWKWWADLHRVAEWDRKIGVALEMSADLPSQEEIDRWLGEPIKCLILPTHVFGTNRKGFPILCRSHMRFVRLMMERDVHLVISGHARHGDLGYYYTYLEHLWNSRSTEIDDVLVSFAKGWEDHLQTPLQPLSDNLDSHTYNIFEKDPVKYDTYQSAIIAALQDRYPDPPKCRGKTKSNAKQESPKHASKNNSVELNGAVPSNLSHSGVVSSVNIPSDSAENVSGTSADNVQMRINEDKSEGRVLVNGVSDSSSSTSESSDVSCPNATSDGSCGCRHWACVMVLGAGRGPLVRAVLNAGTVTNVDLKVYAVEKNPTALLALHAQQREIWRDQVDVVASDMRDFKPPHLADIIISELLGSFGDNELSPECLDGAQHLLRPDGISIPSSYTSYVCPVMSARLWGHVRDSERDFPPHNKPSHHQLETLWVVYLQNKYDIAPPQPLFTFCHPCPPDEKEVDRRRWSRLQFQSKRSCTLHGFSGYFNCVLYGDNTLSILPGEHSPSMISWFPVYCPIKSPISIQPGDVIEVHFWRCRSPRKVWYEWHVTSPQLQSVHNQGGRSSDMLL